VILYPQQNAVTAVFLSIVRKNHYADEGITGTYAKNREALNHLTATTPYLLYDASLVFLSIFEV
jgi:hypothetical protein